MTASAFGFRYAHENPFSLEYSCGVCSRATSDEDLDSMIVCEGGCKRIFHIDCIGLSALPDSSTFSKWACGRCMQRLRSCHICDGVVEKQSSSSSVSSLIKCAVPHCGKSFHRDCLGAKYPKSEILENNFEEESSGICPLHSCALPGCTAPITDESYFCILCLKAYHLRCLPEQIEVVCENACVCQAHQWHLPKGGGEVSLKERLRNLQLGRPTASRVKKVRIGNSGVYGRSAEPWCESVTTSTTPAVSPRVEYRLGSRAWFAFNFSAPFKLDARVSNAALLAPPATDHDTSGLQFTRLRTNEWLCARPRQRDSDEDGSGVCACVDLCGPECPNLITMTQCSWFNCRPTNEVKKAGGAHKKFQCGNKPFLLQGSVKKKMYKVEGAGGKGVGLVAATEIPSAQFLIEYIGEVMTIDGWADRQKLAAGIHKHFYVMELGPDLLVDASRKGNDSRLINHSCDPNLETQKWTVDGEQRVGLFACRQIAAGEELTFNYQFETFASKPCKCLCGTARCSGWIGGKLKKDPKEPQVVRKGDLLPYALLETLTSVDIRIAVTRSDGTRKKETEMRQEEISVLNSKVDFALQHVWAGPSSGEEWVKGGRVCAACPGPWRPEDSGASNPGQLTCTNLVASSNFTHLPPNPLFNPAAILGLSISKVEEHFIKERNLLVIRNLGKARRDFARKFYFWPEKLPAIEIILEANLISDDLCVRCRRSGKLLWCPKCVRCFHQCCLSQADKRLGEDEVVCRRCCRLGLTGQLPLARRSADCNARRTSYWTQVVLPALLEQDVRFVQRRVRKK